MNDALRASYRFCGALSRKEAKNFYYSFLVLPAPLRRSMCALYAFLRHTDDLADEPAPALEQRARLDAWRRSVDQALTGGAAICWPGLPALVDTVERHTIPRRYLDEVIDGVEIDLDPRPFATFEDLHGYCYRVASVVGLSCIHIWGYRSDGGRAEELAEACGVALQLTNILRDVREDATRGRIYLPQEDLDRFGVLPEDLVADRTSDRLRSLLAFEAQRAYEYYEKGADLDHLIEPVGRPVHRTIVGIYRRLLDEIVSRRYEVLASRVSLSPWRKAAITVRSFSGRFERSEPSRAEVPRC
ncbi:farnesyl-diphosphate farnesyltransferase [Singulisphaera sp. GP187]|uniref:phytoene/squalene synthase family protein n=1 Tax=Singulisphaera sp. GP187 TaxID=1882752 RepID=UPI00092846A3|nr:phytoene/squalene synthase family protein [Singulisphaera sp. GP187]SIN82841.1 farnesyl-diphosphate farnesyltransferase [Singulisphaera sp. GP187]